MKAITRFSNSLMEKYLPDPFLFVLILTLVIFVMGLGLTESSPIEMVTYWGDGFWALPALAIAGLKAKDIMGFCVIVLLVSGVVIGLGLLFL